MRRFALPVALLVSAPMLATYDTSEPEHVLVAASSSASSAKKQRPFDDVSVAAREAAAKGTSVELVKLRTSKTKTYIRPDGQTVVVRKGSDGKTTRTVRNTAPVVGLDARQSPQRCYNGGLPAATTLTPTFSATVTDVDHAVRKSKVRIRVEVWPIGVEGYDRLKAKNSVAHGVSAWAKPGTRVGWKVPAGTLKQGEEYAWRARAEDGTSVGPWASWMWQAFEVDTNEKAERQPCSGEGFLDMAYVQEIGVALDALVEKHPKLYSYASMRDDGVELYPVRQRGRTAAQDVAAARAAAKKAIMGAKGEYLTDEYRRLYFANLTVVPVKYTRTELDKVEAEIEKRMDANDPLLPEITGWSISGEHNRVEIEAIDPTAVQKKDLKARYGNRAAFVESSGYSYPA